MCRSPRSSRGHSYPCAERPQPPADDPSPAATPFALVAWDHTLLLDAFDEGPAHTFEQRAIGTTVPEQAAC
jgi:hypothetical protein